VCWVCQTVFTRDADGLEEDDLEAALSEMRADLSRHLLVRHGIKLATSSTLPNYQSLESSSGRLFTTVHRFLSEAWHSTLQAARCPSIDVLIGIEMVLGVVLLT